MQSRFMQQALLALLLLAPMTAAMGILVVNFRMAFFAEAISHSAFTGVALGMLLTVSPELTMPLFGLAVGLGIVAAQHHSSLASDTVIGVFFSGMVAFGLAMVSRDRSLARDMQRFLYGDILTIIDFLQDVKQAPAKPGPYRRILPTPAPQPQLGVVASKPPFSARLCNVHVLCLNHEWFRASIRGKTVRNEAGAPR